MFTKMPTGLFPEPPEFIPYIYYLRSTLLSPSYLRLGHSSFLLAQIICISKLAACSMSSTSHSSSCYCTVLRVRIVQLNSKRSGSGTSTYC
jgi:hypothetical protein